jgi:hypothetical protein
MGLKRRFALLFSERPADAARRFVIEAVLHPLVTTRKLDTPSYVSTVRALADWLAKKALTEAEAERLVDKILATRRYTVKPSDIQDGAKAVVGCRPEGAALAGDTSLMQRWPMFIADLRAQLGPERVDFWFSTVVIVSKVNDRAELATHRQHVANKGIRR